MMKILWKRLLRRLGRLVQRIGRRIEDKGYVSHDTSLHYTLGRGTLYVTNKYTGKLVEVHHPKLTPGPEEEKT